VPRLHLVLPLPRKLLLVREEINSRAVEDRNKKK
jgi:hypothetical protein